MTVPPVALYAHERRVVGLLADPDCTDDLLLLGMALARLLDIDQSSGRGLDLACVPYFAASTPRGLVARLRAIVRQDARRGVLPPHFPDVDWPKLYRWADPTWTPPAEEAPVRPRLRVLTGGRSVTPTR